MIATQQDNPDGLYRRYNVTKANGEPDDPRAVYFVLRLDGNGDDKDHIEACRMAARMYAMTARKFSHLTQMTDELIALVDDLDKAVPKSAIKSAGEKTPIPGVMYIEFSRPQSIGEFHDGDSSQMLTEMPRMCQSFECLRWVGNIQMAPVLVDRDGFRVCSACGGSYGAVTE